MCIPAGLCIRTLHTIYLHDPPPDWFFDVIPDFLGRYDRINAAWRSLAFTRPSFDRPASAHDMDFDPDAPTSSQQPPVSVSQKCLRDVGTFDSHVSPMHVATPYVSYKRPRLVETTTALVTESTPVSAPHHVHIEVDNTAPSPTQPTPVSVPPHAHIEVSTIPHATQQVSDRPTRPIVDVEVDTVTPPVTSPFTPVSDRPITPRINLEIKTHQDKFKDMERRGGRYHSGDLMRTLKNRKTALLF